MIKLLSVLFATASAEGVVETASTLADTPLFTKGLIVTAGGLCGVFLVLILFFFTIKLLQKILK